ncbi:MAG: GAF domain-containing sensor histidine kinase, partial [Deltaproteobacteria bacterium]
IPIQEDGGAVPACVLEGETVIVRDGESDPLRKLIERVTRPGDTGRAFASVPLIGKGKTIGALVVDNRFLVSERQISQDDVSGLEAFASMIAMSIQNAELQARLAEEQRLETWKEFAARVAHIIGTRIAIIEGVVTQLRFRLLEEKAVEAEQLKDVQPLLGDLSKGIRNAEAELKDFRRFAAPLVLQFGKVDIAQVLKSVLQEVRYSLNFPVELVLPNEPLTVQGDPASLSSAFIELIRNAQEAMQQETGRASQITITASREASPTSPGTVAQIEFADSGPGVSQEDKKRLFDPFFSTKGRGSGLGLAVVKNIIEQHQGTIKEVGLPGTGARLIVCLPYTE